MHSLKQCKVTPIRQNCILHLATFFDAGANMNEQFVFMITFFPVVI